MALPRPSLRRSLAGAAAVAVVASGATAVSLGGAVADEPVTPAAPCLRTDAVLTVEESRLGEPLLPGGEPAARRFVEAAGFDGLVQRFYDRLCGATSLAAAERVVRFHGQRLWDVAVARAQGGNGLGTIDRYDDRPLYWARTTMSAAVRSLDADYLESGLQRQALLRILDRTSRGHESIAWPAGDAERVMISGFDTYSLDASLRNSNPSGATALQLDGRTLDTPEGPVTVQAVVLPVNYTDFDQGVVEDAFGQVLRTGEDRADLIMTISQTGRGRMDIEQWAANARGGSPDNNRNQQFGPVSRPSYWPQPYTSPNWIETTLPYQAMIDAGTGPWPVVLNDGICEWPAGTFDDTTGAPDLPDPTELVCKDDPSPGSAAASGPGGSYLSNESMYRSNRLRLGMRAWDVPGGHLHISALQYPTDLDLLTDPAFEADRKAVVDQTIALVAAAGAAVDER
ncbi:hypothetical protein [Vallicoccus soli]|uniref:Pyroglutamyl peptidase n=1 Tax=Vallicoccus soli TaxID=2339232 RepID=A0A3A3Z6S5_9ACTN|nr:hypothetical protein [Vallicoccus soli]RJK96415.1 hypothetical protein D5H78_09310 [Vallicoccus soli]